jgi:hypothetical protein
MPQEENHQIYNDNRQLRHNHRYLFDITSRTTLQLFKRKLNII